MRALRRPRVGAAWAPGRWRVGAASVRAYARSRLEAGLGIGGRARRFASKERARAEDAGALAREIEDDAGFTGSELPIDLGHLVFERPLRLIRADEVFVSSGPFRSRTVIRALPGHELLDEPSQCAG